MAAGHYGDVDSGASSSLHAHPNKPRIAVLIHAGPERKLIEPPHRLAAYFAMGHELASKRICPLDDDSVL